MASLRQNGETCVPGPEVKFFARPPDEDVRGYVWATATRFCKVLIFGIRIGGGHFFRIFILSS